MPDVILVIVAVSVTVMVTASPAVQFPPDIVVEDDGQRDDDTAAMSAAVVIARSEVVAAVGNGLVVVDVTVAAMVMPTVRQRFWPNVRAAVGVLVGVCCNR